jgi:Membrane domain of glycerophosphoryl diester phosphodiesterase.
VDAAFQILRTHYSQFVMCSALAYLPWLIVELVLLGDPEKWAGTSWWIGVLAGMGVWMSFALMSSAIVTCASQAYLGDPVDVALAIRRAAGRLPRVMIAALLRYVMLTLGFICLLVGALWVAARLFALTPLIILEDASLSTAFTRSAALSNGRKRHILNTLGLAAIIYWVVAIGISMMASLAGNFVIQVLAGAIYTILAYPIIAITECLLYYDARIQSEGLDIELMAAELGDASILPSAR